MRTTPRVSAQSPQELLEASAWFPRLDTGAQRQVVSDAIERAVVTGDVLVRHGKPANWWFGVLEGVLKWSASTHDGRTVTLGGLSTGSWFGEGSLLRGLPVQADIVALRFSRVVMVPKATFEWLHDTQPTFGKFLISQINERLHWFMGDFAAHRLLGVEAQVARALAGLMHPCLHPGSNLHLQISQEELANLAGLSRQRCNQALSQLKAAALVRTEYGGLTIMDLERLRQAAEVEWGPSGDEMEAVQ